MTAQPSNARMVITDAPGAEDELVIREGLSDYNFEKAGYRDQRPLAILVSDPETGEVVGGLFGSTSIGLLDVIASFCLRGCASKVSGPGSSRRPKKRGCGVAAARLC